MPDWNRGQMRSELYAYGFQYLAKEGNRGNDLLTQANGEVVAEREWPFRETHELILPGESVVGLGKVQQITIEDGTVLEPKRRDALVDAYGRNPDSGTPRFYYVYGQDRIYTYPSTTVELGLMHVSRAGWVALDGTRKMTPTLDSDGSVVPEDFRDAVVLKARELAKLDAGNTEEAADLASRYEERIEDMAENLLVTQVDEPQYVKTTNPDWH